MVFRRKSPTAELRHDAESSVEELLMSTANRLIATACLAALSLYPRTLPAVLTEHEIAKLVPSTTADWTFAGSVAISGGTVVAGAYSEDRPSSFDSGAAYVFQHDVSGWHQTQRIAPGASGHSFASAVAVSGDLMALSAHGKPAAAGALKGGVYVYENIAGTWLLDDIIVPPTDFSDIDGGTDFGRSLALDGNRLIIGAAGDDSSGTWTGAAFVYERTGGNWTKLAKLVSSQPAGQRYFGTSVDIAGSTAAVISRSGTLSSVEIFREEGGIWNFEARKLPDVGEWFGSVDQKSVAVDGDIVAVGSQQLTSGGIYVFERQSDATWPNTAKLSSGASGSTNATWSVDIAGNWLVGGANAEKVGANFFTGAAYLFHHTPAGWQIHSHLRGADVVAGTSANFGYTVSLEDGLVAVGRRPYSLPQNGYEPGVYLFIVPEPDAGWLALICAGVLVLTSRQYLKRLTTS
jgi:hypothetical protein